jgi:hypothetical protein
MNATRPLAHRDGCDNQIGLAIDDADVARTFVADEKSVIARRLQTDWRQHEDESNEATEKMNFHQAMIKAWT